MNITWDEKQEWASDENGNRCSVAYFGTKAAAEKALRSLKNCHDCINCSNCSKCLGCSYCSDCSDCSRCSDCSNCSDCSYCSDCSDCSRCSRCSRCSDCSNCSDCSDCSRCSRCSRCSDCSNCSDCSDCSGRHRISDTTDGRIEAPRIPDMDAKVFAAASAEGALEMGDWHTCSETHCWAGWIVNLAGDEGRALEKRFDTPLAAMLIARESGNPISPVNFFISNDEALKAMKARAEAN